MLDIASLKPLPVFSLAQAEIPELHLEYCRYYGMNFQEQGLCERHIFGGLHLANYQIAVHYFECSNPRGTLVINHGYLDHSALYSRIISPLLKADWNVLIYDLPGHGLSSGMPASIDSFDDYQQVLSALMDKMQHTLPGPHVLMGQSTGGAIAMDYVLNTPQHGFKCLVLLAPLVIPKGWAGIQLQLLLVGRIFKQAPRAFRSNSQDKGFVHFLQNDDGLQTRWMQLKWIRALKAWQTHFQQSGSSTLPTLVLQGDDDRTVSWRYNLTQVQEKFKHAKIIMLPGASHQLVNEGTAYRRRITDTILAFIDPQKQ